MHNKEEKGLGIKDNNAKSTKIKAKGSVDDQDNPQTQENRSNKIKSKTGGNDNPQKEVPASLNMEIFSSADDVIAPKAVAAKGLKEEIELFKLDKANLTDQLNRMKRIMPKMIQEIKM